MLRVKIDGDKKLQRALNNAAKDQITFATSLGINNTAKIARKDLVSKMKQVFDKPTRFTLNSVRIIPSTKKLGGKPSKYGYMEYLRATVELKDEAFKAAPASVWLKPQIEGGERSPKKSERLLRHVGLLGKNELTVPGGGMKLNKSGNVVRGRIQKLLSGVSAQFDKYQNTEQGKSGYFVGEVRGKRAVWLRDGVGSVKPMLVITGNHTYKKRFDFDGTVKKSVGRNLNQEIEKALRYALKTAR